MSSPAANDYGAEKRAHPDRFCPRPGCLWRTGGAYCPRHKPEPSDPAPVAARVRALQQDGEASEEPDVF